MRPPRLPRDLGVRFKVCYRAGFLLRLLSVSAWR